MVLEKNKAWDFPVPPLFEDEELFVQVKQRKDHQSWRSYRITEKATILTGIEWELARDCEWSYFHLRAYSILSTENSLTPAFQLPRKTVLISELLLRIGSGASQSTLTAQGFHPPALTKKEKTNVLDLSCQTLAFSSFGALYIGCAGH